MSGTPGNILLCSGGIALSGTVCEKAATVGFRLRDGGWVCACEEHEPAIFQGLSEKDGAEPERFTVYVEG